MSFLALRFIEVTFNDHLSEVATIYLKAKHLNDLPRISLPVAFPNLYVQQAKRKSTL